ncbi:MAG TPA: SDR family oxidoreductase [Gemmatimonadaceae bacterium]|nr:SDR family oxidoreductase [Gemmatimonadaceae bacterium]
MILVAGATGVLGSEIVRRLLDRGESVRAMVRATSDPEKVERLESAGAETVRADLKEPASLAPACAGVNAVISTVTTILTSQAGDSFEVTDGKGNMSLIDAARDAGVGKFVFVSFDTNALPENPLSNAKEDVEEHLKKSGLDYTILHPSLFFESWLGPMLFADPVAGTATVYGDGTDKIRYVAVADVAEFAVQSLSRPVARNATIVVGGPEEISQRDAVRIFEEAFGKEFKVAEVPEAALEAKWMAAQDPFEKTFAGLMLGVARGFDLGAPPPFEDFPMRMTSPREYARRMASAAAKPADTVDRTASRVERPSEGGQAELR